MKNLVCRFLLLLFFSLTFSTLSGNASAQTLYQGPSNWLNSFAPDHFKSKQQLQDIAQNYHWTVSFEDRETSNPEKVNQIRILGVNNYRRIVSAVFYQPSQQGTWSGAVGWLNGIDLSQIRGGWHFEDLVKGRGWRANVENRPTNDPEFLGRLTINRILESNHYIEASYGSEYRMPDLRGRSEREVLDLFGGSRLIPEFFTIETTDVSRADTVVQQSIPPGRIIPAEQVVNAGLKNQVTLLRLKAAPMPNLIGKTVAEASALLKGHPAKIWSQTLKVQTTDLSLRNKIKDQNPKAGEIIDKETWVGLTLYEYIGNVTVPNVTKMTRDEAIQKLSAAGLGAKIIAVDLADFYQKYRNEYNPEYSYKLVEIRYWITGQQVAAGSSVAAGTAIGIEVLTPRFTPVPNMIDLSCDGEVQAENRKLLATLGKTIVILTNEHVNDASKDNKIIRTIPAAGSRIGTSYTLTEVCGRSANIIPDLVGKPEAEVRTALTKLGVTSIESGYYPSTDHPDGQVYNIWPSPGSIIKADTKVSLSVVKREGAIQIPFLFGKLEAEAIQILKDLGLNNYLVGDLHFQRNDIYVSEKDIGKVNRMTPTPGTIVYDPKTEVTIQIAHWVDEQPVEVPNIGLLKEATAIAMLEAKGLVPEIHYQITTDTLLGGTASAKTAPAVYTKVTRGSRVAITIYTLQAKVPSLSQFSEADAIALLSRNQLKAQIEYRDTDNKFAAGKVVEQIPAKYSMVTPGSTIKLIVSRYSGMVKLPDWFGRLQSRSPEDEDVKVGFNYLKTEKKLQIETRFADTIFQIQLGKIARTEPATATMVAEGSTIVIYVYRLLQAIPDVTGRSESEARQTLEALGFAVKVQYTQDGEPGKVSYQSQKAGSPPDHAAITLLARQPLIAPMPNMSIRLSETEQADREKINAFYQTFKEAYENKNEAQVMNLISGNWSSGDGTTLMDMEDNLRNMFNVFDDLQYNISGLSIQPAGAGIYNVSYSATIRGTIFDNDLNHEEVSSVTEQVIIDSSGQPKIYKTLGGGYWSIQ